jgi:hypothetical protein
MVHIVQYVFTITFQTLNLLYACGQTDRHNTYREVGDFFPCHEDPLRPLRSTIIDGELVVDDDPRMKQVHLMPNLLSFSY